MRRAAALAVVAFAAACTQPGTGVELTIDAGGATGRGGGGAAARSSRICCRSRSACCASSDGGAVAR